jgi:hydrogenase maturation protein HypF
VIETWRWLICGHVQGVGFRPFVFRLAALNRLSGWVRNRLGQVEIVAQGSPGGLAIFENALIRESPLIARPRIQSREVLHNYMLPEGFRIEMSTDQDRPRIQVPPDYFLCQDCLAEMRDSSDRRYRYPFINCTQCGPRYTLIKSLPYDRQNTSMAGFEMCSDCRQEYEDPSERRFHAEPIACASCGPQLLFTASGGEREEDTQGALQACIASLRAGRVVAAKGVGGYHLFCDARNDGAILRLRHRKPRPAKPLAVMFPERGHQGLEAVLEELHLSAKEADLISGSQRPIVLAGRRPQGKISELIAPGLGEIGAMLPYSPLHHLLLDDFGGPLVATSGNISGEPVLTDNDEVQRRLMRVAEAFLHHNRPIERPADDAVYRSIRGTPRPLRLGRGFAPLELELPFTLDRPILAVGGHIKNTVALGWEDRVVISPHIGDLGAPRSQRVFEQIINDLQSLYRVEAQALVCDAHKGYASTRWARGRGLPLAEVYHHHAHASALAGEHQYDTDWIVFTWDGTGLGEDASLWGGEALVGRPGTWRRIASFRPFYLPGGEMAAREPWRSAAALCWEADIDWTACPRDTGLLHQAWRRRLNCPKTSAVGRMFDAAASLTGVLHEASFEGQGPMLLEAVARAVNDAQSLPIRQDNRGLWLTDWEPLLVGLMDSSLSLGQRASVFHGAMAKVILDQARLIRERHSTNRVGLCGGVFQNRLLTELAVEGLERDGFIVHLTRTLPCNDGGLSFGQMIEYGTKQQSL